MTKSCFEGKGVLGTFFLARNPEGVAEPLSGLLSEAIMIRLEYESEKPGGRQN